MEIDFTELIVNSQVGGTFFLPFLKQISGRSGTHSCRIAKLRLFTGLTKRTIVFNIVRAGTFRQIPAQLT